MYGTETNLAIPEAMAMTAIQPGASASWNVYNIGSHLNLSCVE
jgi:hypothetical protein